MKKHLLITFLFSTILSWSQEITLNHNIGNNIVDLIDNFTCSGGGVKWARTFVLEDFGVTGEYTLTSGSFGVQEANTAPGNGIRIRIYSIDEGFPDTFDEANLLGTSPQVDIPSNASRQIFEYDFNPPIVVPQNIDRILVEATQGFESQLVFLGGTSDSFDFSWMKTPSGCGSSGGDGFVTTFDLNRPDLNFYITVTGDNVLSVEDNLKDRITLSPNPVTNMLKLGIKDDLDLSEAVILDMTGKEVMHLTVAEEIDLSLLPSGMYFLQMDTSKGRISEKIIKQ